MAEQSPQPVRRRDEAEPSWSQVWQLPALLLGVGLFALGMWLAWPQQEQFDHAGALERVEQYLAAGNLEAAEEHLEHAVEFVDEASAQQQARLWELWGDVRYRDLQQRYARPVDTPGWRQNQERVVGYYRRAQEAGEPIDWTLSNRSNQRLAQTLVLLGRQEHALAMVDQLAEAGAEPRQRYLILRRLIEQQRQRGPETSPSQLAPLLNRFAEQIRLEPDAQRRRQQQIWLTEQRAELHLEVGDAGGAIDELLLRIQRLGDEGDLGTLWTLLARAYQQQGELAQAQRYYQLAQQQVEPSDELNARILLGLGQIELARADASRPAMLQRAQAMFAQVVEQFPSEDAALDALLGQGDAEARLGLYEQALEHFAQAVAELGERPSWDRRRAQLERIVRDHVQDLAQRADYERGLDFLSLLRPLQEGDWPAELLRDFALLHERYAQQQQARAERARQRLQEQGDAQARDAARLASQQAAIHFEQAGRYHYRHAQQVTISDDAAHGQSLWSAARSFDRAQHWEQAIEVYDEFINTRDHDPRVQAARRLLGQAYLAAGDEQAAADRLERLVDEHPRSPEAYESLVPLAQALIGLERYDRAERVLREVVTDHEAIIPGSEEYRQALIELGRLYYDLGEQDGAYYAQAIGYLDEAVTRYGQTRQGPRLHFKLADAYRRSVPELEEALQRTRSQRDRLALQQEREQRLQHAQDYYERAIERLEALPEAALSDLERIFLRNAYFYSADTAFDRQDYSQAIELYQQAAQRWEQDPASLMALSQIFIAHCELGQFQQAEVANQRALARLAQIPDEAFKDDYLPMDKRHWEDWLRWRAEVYLADGREG